VKVSNVWRHDDTFTSGEPELFGSYSAGCGALENLKGFRPSSMQVRNECSRGAFRAMDLEHPAAA
jgi:hypothetical protein